MSTHEQADPARERRAVLEAIVASTVGTTIEWYDFFLYGTVAALVFPRLFFPDFDPEADLIAHRVMRARLAEPVHGIGAGAGVPGTFDDGWPGIAFASTAQIFPVVVSGQATIGLADRVLADILPRLGASAPRELATTGA